MRKIYQAVILPQLPYGVTAWYDRNSSNIPATERNKRAGRFAALQKRAAVIISGAFKGTAAAASDVELYMQPMELQMERIAQETAIRILTGPKIGCPEGLRRHPTGTGGSSARRIVPSGGTAMGARRVPGRGRTVGNTKSICVCPVRTTPGMYN
jgi:hypothetical protein